MISTIPLQLISWSISASKVQVGHQHRKAPEKKQVILSRPRPFEERCFSDHKFDAFRNGDLWVDVAAMDVRIANIYIYMIKSEWNMYICTQCIRIYDIHWYTVHDTNTSNIFHLQGENSISSSNIIRVKAPHGTARLQHHVEALMLQPHKPMGGCPFPKGVESESQFSNWGSWNIRIYDILKVSMKTILDPHHFQRCLRYLY